MASTMKRLRPTRALSKPMPMGKKKKKMQQSLSTLTQPCSSNSNGESIKEKLEIYRQKVKADQLKKQRLLIKKRREAAKMELEKMENTVGNELNGGNGGDFLKELWVLTQGPPTPGKALNQLGLFIKHEYNYMAVDDDDDDQAEEEKSNTLAVLDRETEIKRQAARMALEKMEENTACIELNGDILKELWVLTEGPPSPGRALNQLGLFIKNEYNYMAVDDDDDDEILS